MVIYIYAGSDRSYVSLGSNDKRFSEGWGNLFKIPTSNIHQGLIDVSNWCQKEFNEKCFYEVKE